MRTGPPSRVSVCKNLMGGYWGTAKHNKNVTLQSSVGWSDFDTADLPEKFLALPSTKPWRWESHFKPLSERPPTESISERSVPDSDSRLHINSAKKS